MSELRTRLSRREAIAKGAIVLGALAAAPKAIEARTDDEISHTADAIHQEVMFKASKDRVYKALTDSAQFNSLMKLSAAMQSGMALGNKPTTIGAAEGGSFVVFGGHIVGRQIELVPNERIVQAWRVTDWDPGVYSIAKFVLSDESSGTKLVFDHNGFPQGQAQHLADGWRANYWEPLAKFLS